jgi:hypothetical protein
MAWLVDSRLVQRRRAQLGGHALALFVGGPELCNRIVTGFLTEDLGGG